MTLYAKILAALLALPVYGEDAHDARKTDQMETIAHAIYDATYDPALEGVILDARAALMIASGFEESGWSLRVHIGRCRRHECDHGRARGPWQVQRNGMSRESWDQMVGLEHTDAQARTAQKRLEMGRAQCQDTRGAIARYFGLPCTARDSAIVVHRWRTYQGILKRMRNE